MRLFDFEDLKEIIFEERDQTGKMPEQVIVTPSQKQHLLMIYNQKYAGPYEKLAKDCELKYMGVKIIVDTDHLLR